MNKLAIKLRKFGRICPIKGYKEEAIKVGAAVVIGTDRGIEFGNIVSFAKEYPVNAFQDVKLKKVIRYATEEDLKKAAELDRQETEALALANQKVKEYELLVKIINVEALFDGGRIIFYCKVADEKKSMGTRDFAKDLSRQLKMRVDIKLVSPRDEARLLGGLGPCGRNLCCAGWLIKPKHITVKMVKQQGLQISPTKTSGMCGRLMCCLGYEYEKKQAEG
jgi:cell fate regulator YaaT (PSP1 superfamily)